MESRYRHLRIKRPYVVIREFRDFDGRVHMPGDRWVFLYTAFLPYDSGRTLVVETPEGEQRWIRMWEDPAGQMDILEHLESYLAPAAESDAAEG